ncbi:hypothetical protein D5S17_02320 [Pseudonocardiaceae bacterium YIM PH 21723]|nr:hypothetical protein D5S17_02320 [Pseudonocardiaceae bacterium YIM PH 21723]
MFRLRDAFASMAAQRDPLAYPRLLPQLERDFSEYQSALVEAAHVSLEEPEEEPAPAIEPVAEVVPEPEPEPEPDPGPKVEMWVEATPPKPFVEHIPAAERTEVMPAIKDTDPQPVAAAAPTLPALGRKAPLVAPPPIAVPQLTQVSLRRSQPVVTKAEPATVVTAPPQFAVAPAPLTPAAPVVKTPPAPRIEADSGVVQKKSKRPSYLISMNDDYYGDSRLVAPPVIGEEPPGFRY